MTESAPYQQDTQEGAELPREAPTGLQNDPSYKTKRGEAVAVVDDDAPVEGRNLGKADSEQQLEADEREAMDKSNIIKQRTRHAKPMGTYKEPTDEQMGLKE
ncbi:hypothetical protein VTJ83DRAFT_2751 [Remersonia thermophila]|uniref:Histone chaperone domain-containing protein n=1 Tax=Remersonia thermophila TaxID=72144 RepID=A0ABR4DJU8_9PEZI